MSTPPPPDLVVPVAEVAAGLGLDPNDNAVRDAITRAILDAQATVENYLGRFILPRQVSEAGRTPGLTSWDLHGDDIIEVTDRTPEFSPIDGVTPTGRFTVTYTAGLDVRTDARPSFGEVRRFVRAHAENAPAVVRLWRAADPAREKLTKSVSAEGQSISYARDTPSGTGEVAKTGSGAPGAMPSLEGLDSLRLAGRRAFQRPTAAVAAPAYGGWGLG